MLRNYSFSTFMGVREQKLVLSVEKRTKLCTRYEFSAPSYMYCTLASYRHCEKRQRDSSWYGNARSSTHAISARSVLLLELRYYSTTTITTVEGSTKSSKRDDR